jgi:Fe-S-cluster containining protein
MNTVTLTPSVGSVKESLELLSKKWNIPKEVYDIHIGNRRDLADTTLKVENVTFHIPTLKRDELYILWKCLWPDCHNCCERQGRLPLTKDDIKVLTRKTGYDSEAEFIKKEARISSWDEKESVGNVITSFTMLSLKRKIDEKDDEDGTILPCRFLNVNGHCKLHPQKPGVCSLYPFATWLETDNGKPAVHATFQFTGDCPGFYVSKSLDDIRLVLSEYSNRIYDYNMSVSRTKRDNYGFIDIVNIGISDANLIGSK